MKIHTLQPAFNGGEVSPDMWARTDYNKYASSLKTMENFYPRYCGGACNRAGTEFITEVKDSSTAVRLIPFQFSTTQNYIIEAGNEYFRYYMNGGQIVSGSTIVETTTPYSSSDVWKLKYAQSADTMYLCNSSYPIKTLGRSSHYVWNLADFDFKYGPYRTGNVDTTLKLTPSGKTGNITVTASSSVFTANMVGSLLRISHDVYGQTVSKVGVGDANVSAGLQCYGNWSFMITDPANWTINLEISNDNGTTWKVLKSYSQSERSSAITDSGTIDHYCLLRVNQGVSSDGIGSYSLSCDSFVNDGYVKITAYSSGTSITGTVVTDEQKYIWGLSSTDATSDWGIGAWNTEYGYPSCVQFFQNRLGFAGSTKDPLTLWLSNVSDYPNFRVHETVEDDDAITAALASGSVNAIQSMISTDYLLAFTAGGLWRIGTGSESTAFTPSSARARQQGYIGTTSLQPLIIGNGIISSDYTGNEIHAYGYNAVSDKYDGTNLSVLVDHMFKNHSIVDWAYAPSPDGIVWAVRDDGVLLSLTYLAEQKVWAWSRHVTDGLFESVAVITNDTYSEVWFVVKRKINGSWKRYIERMANRQSSTDPQDQFFVDSGLSYDNPIDITGATQASPVVITAPSHGLSAGDVIDISDVEGMTELNGGRYKVGTVTTDTFTLLKYDDGTSIDGTSFTAYEDSGYVRKCIKNVTGLSHLEGKTVAILANGSPQTEQVVASGAITLNDYASRIHVGLPYTSTMETLNIDYPLQDGTAQGRKRRIVDIKLMLEDTKGGTVGVNDNDMQDIEYASTLGLNTIETLYTGQKHIVPANKHSEEAHVTVKQTYPLPITVLAIMTEVELGG